jgi:hypothetical protein
MSRPLQVALALGMLACLALATYKPERPRPAAPPLVGARYQWGDGPPLCMVVEDVAVRDGAAWVWVRPCEAEGARPTPITPAQWELRARVWAEEVGP